MIGGFLTVIIILFFIVGVVFLLRRYMQDSTTRNILECVFIVMVFRWGLFEISTVPTGSMEGSIMPGDFTLVSKLHFGPRTPKTLLQVPLTHQTTHFLKIPSYLSWIRLPMYRFAGFRQIKRGDVVVFNTPSDRGLNTDMKTFYVKRCIGLPGEEIKCRGNEFYINGENVDFYPNKLLFYVIESENILTSYWFKTNNISTYRYLKGNKYLISTTEDNIKKIKEKDFITSVDFYKDERDDIFISNAPNYENLSSWGPIKIPYAGMTIDLNKDTIKLYAYAIELDSRGKFKFDCVDIQNNAIIIDSTKISQDLNKLKKYTFTQDHYFMVGDNRYNSADSRYWGFVPQDHIYAKTLCILFSKKPNSWISGLSFSRAFKVL
ncbi:MAG: signal peptidase I [Cytophagales bacterium]|nr:signal peptidase I [Cytophagales bacterium]